MGAYGGGYAGADARINTFLGEEWGKPCRGQSYCEYRYFNINQLMGIDDDLDFEEFRDLLEELLPKSFSRSRRDRRGSRTSAYSDSDPLFENGLVSLVIENSAYGYDYVGIGFVVNDNDLNFDETYVLNFGPRYLDNLAEKFFKQLNCDQSIRTSTWTSKLVKTYKP